MNNSFITNKGKRESNQDVILTKKIGLDQELYLLADGMGGYKNGEYAANFIVNNLHELLRNKNSFDKNIIQSAINNVTMALTKENEVQGLKMGATLGGVIIDKGEIYSFWVGDVKIFHIRKKKILYQSIEHNLKNELIEKKIFVEANNANKYNHIVTRSIQNDINKSIIGYKCIKDFKEGDIIILCSDGVTDTINNHELINVFNSQKEIPDILSELDANLSNIANDNYTLMLLF